MTQIYFPELWISEWEMNILVVWDQHSHRKFYFPYAQPVLILNVCQSYFLSWKINENNIISHAEIKMYAYFISTNTFCFLAMLYLKAHKTNVFVLIKKKALETSYSLSAQNCTDEGKLLINPYNLKAVVNLRFHCVLEDGRLLQAYPAPRDVTVYLHAPKKHIQEAEGIRPGNLRSNLFTQLSWLITHNLLWYLHFHHQGFQKWLKFVPRMSSVWNATTLHIVFTCPKILHVLWQGICYLWQRMPFQCLLWLL